MSCHEIILLASLSRDEINPVLIIGLLLQS
jgi:hypothetical protein